jgi:hypothetical protein
LSLPDNREFVLVVDLGARNQKRFRHFHGALVPCFAGNFTLRIDSSHHDSFRAQVRISCEVTQLDVMTDTMSPLLLPHGFRFCRFYFRLSICNPGRFAGCGRSSVLSPRVNLQLQRCRISIVYLVGCHVCTLVFPTNSSTSRNCLCKRAERLMPQRRCCPLVWYRQGMWAFGCSVTGYDAK